MAEPKQFCTFYINKMFFGIEVLRVQEVIRHLEMTRIPSASPTIRGLINLRGQIVTAIDLRRRLEFEDRPADLKPVNVVVRTDDGVYSLLVDDIGDVLELEEDLLDRIPDTVRGTPRHLIQDVYKLPDNLLMTLDVDRALDLGSAA